MPSIGQPHGIAAKTPWLLGLVFFCAALWLFTRHADFPSYYHADEPSKVDQLLREYRNFKHPPLMLNAAEGVATILQTPRDAESLVRLGRFLSALYASGTVALLALLAARLRSPGAGVVAGLLVLFCPPLYEAAHYYKEDTLFLFLGCLLAVMLVWRTSTPRPVLSSTGLLPPCLFGGVIALLACSRYFTLLFLPLLFFGLSLHRSRRAAVGFFGSFAMVVALIHWPSLPWLPSFFQELPLETRYMVRGHYDVGLPVPHAAYPRYWLQQTNLFIWILLAFFLYDLIRRRPQGPILALALLFSYGLILSCLPKYSDRYLLPVLLGTCFFAAWGAAELMRIISRRLAPRKMPLTLFAWTIIVPVLLAFSLPAFLSLEKAFRQDSRLQLAIWMRENLPASHVAQDNLLQLQVLAGPKFQYSGDEFVADLGTLADLRDQGIRYLAICRRTHYSYTAQGQLASNSTDPQFLHRQNFYRTLLQHGKVLWQAPDQDPKILHPGITLLELPDLPTADDILPSPLP